MKQMIPWMLALAACADSSTEAPSDSRPVLSIAGSETMTTALVPALTEVHERSIGSVRFEVTGGGSGAGFSALINGDAALAAATREHTVLEATRAQDAGFDLDDDDSVHIVGVDVVALSAHPSTTVTALTYDQVIGIFCTGTIDDWSYLGLPAQPIRALSRTQGSGTRALFEDFFCGPDGIGDHVQTMPMDEIRLTLEADPSALTYVSMTEPIGRVVGLKPDPRGQAVLPSQRNVLRGTYPLFHDIRLYTRGAPTGEVASFLVWAASPAGQEVVDEQGFVPLFIRPDHLDSPRPLRETMHFEADSATLTRRSEARLSVLVDELRGRSDAYDHIVLEGFTDSEEPDALALSRQRAEAVRDALVPDLPGVFMEIIPRGAIDPIAPNGTAYGRERNRRVQIYLAAEEAPEPQLVAGEGTE